MKENPSQSLQFPILTIIDLSSRICPALRSCCPASFSSFRDVVWNTAKNLVEVSSKSLVHVVINNRIDTCVRHCQPVEGEVDMTDIGCPHDGWVMVGEYKINVVRGPTHHENDHHKGKHLDNFLFVIPALSQSSLQ